MTELTPLFEDNNRKGSTRAEAIYGDKHAQFELSATGEQEVAAVQHEIEKRDLTVNHMGELAARQLAILEFSNQHPDIPQERLDAMVKAQSRR